MPRESDGATARPSPNVVVRADWDLDLSHEIAVQPVDAHRPVVATRDERARPRRRRAEVRGLQRGRDLALVGAVESDAVPCTGCHPHVPRAGCEDDVMREERRNDRALEPRTTGVPEIEQRQARDFDPSDVQSAVPSGLTETCRAGPGTCVRDTTRPRPTSSATTSSLAESVTYAIDRFGCTAVYRGAVKPSSSTRTSRAAASTIETSPCRLCATAAILVSTLSMLAVPEPFRCAPAFGRS